MKFQDLEHFTNDDVEAAISRNDPSELQFVPVTIALTSSDQSFAEDICIKLAVHGDNKVRGNAIMSLGHIARRFHKLNEQAVKPLIESALTDADEYVHMLAKSAADEIHQFLGWAISGHVYG